MTAPFGHTAVGTEERTALDRIAERGDRWMSAFLVGHGLLALALAPVHQSWGTTVVVGGGALLAFALARGFAPRTLFTRMVAGVALQAFCALHIHQMAGQAEMHFFFFTATTALIIYQDWRALWPGVLAIIAQHVLFSAWHNAGVHPEHTRFFEADRVSVGTLAFHFGIALAQAAVASWWAHVLRRQTIGQASAVRRAREGEAQVAAIIGTAMDAIVVADAEQRIVRYNPAAERMFGHAAGTMLGQPLARLVPERHRTAHQAHVAASGATGDDEASGSPARPYLAGCRADGSEFPIEASIAHAMIGGAPQYTVILRDVSERVRATTERERLAAVLDATPDAVSIYRPGEGLLYANAPARALLRLTDGARGVEPDLSVLHAPDELARLLGEAYPAAERDGSWLGESVVRHPDGREGVMSHLVLVRRDADGAVDAFTTVQRDLTQQKATEAALRRAEGRLRAAVEGSSRAQYILRAVRAPDRVAGPIVDFVFEDANRAAAEQFGTAVDDMLGTPLLELFPRAREWGLADVFRGVLAGGAPYDGEVQLRDPRLHDAWLRLLVVPLGSAAPDTIAVTSRDVTAIKRAERQLAEREARLDLIYNGTSDLMFLMHVAPAARGTGSEDAEDPAAYRCESINAANARVTGMPSAEVVGRTLDAILPPNDAAAVARRYATAVRTAAAQTYEEQLTLAGGAVHTFETHLTPIVDETGAVTHLLGASRDVTQQRRAEAALRELSTRDELTGLLNRRGLRPLVEQSLLLGRRGGRRDAVLYLDLDRFKPINDTYGHAAGDQALQAVARVLRDTVREGDLVARLGGDEFVVYAVGLAHEGEGRVLAARLAAALAAHNAQAAAAGRPWAIGFSAGVAESEPGDDLDALLARADAALYATKVARV